MFGDFNFKRICGKPFAILVISYFVGIIISFI